ncbi:MAG: arylesterase [Alphaproteobacteria bacterium]|nr:arylesterase [Alphaproteobacteria bacterium]
MLTACGEGQPIATPVKIVAFGDSLTAGYQLPANKAMPAILQERFAQNGHTGVHIINMGISGDTTQDGLARLNLVLNAQPDIVILELGANDILRQISASKSRENLEEMIEELLDRDIRVLLSGVKIPNIYVIGNKNMGDYGAMFDSLSEKYDIEYYPNFLAGVQGKAEMNLQDGLHPNADGAKGIANRLYPLVLDMAQDVAKQTQSP